jgi:hypothetical protein
MQSQASAYSFWMSHIGEMKQLSSDKPETVIVPGRPKAGEVLQSFRSPDGQEYSIVSERQEPTPASSKLEEAAVTTNNSNAEMPYEWPLTDPSLDQENFERLATAFIKKFGEEREGNTLTYIMADSRVALLVDANDPNIFSYGFLKGETASKAFKKALTQPPGMMLVSRMKKDLRAVPEGTYTVKIHGSTYNVKYLKIIANIFGKGGLHFYPIEELGHTNYPVAISDGKGHFIILSPRDAGTNENPPVLLG